MDPRTLEWLQLLARALLWAGAIVLVLSVIGAIQIATSQNELGIAPEFERQSRGIVAVGALGAGITAAGILAGLGAILRLMLDARGRGPGA
ncbi:MAG TPA: hypothetical protein VEK39_09240 [Solirubrobacterales bacterium]|nr:hypothetical protein [Solirubrobacterales bacterium]